MRMGKVGWDMVEWDGEGMGIRMRVDCEGGWGYSGYEVGWGRIG